MQQDIFSKQMIALMLKYGAAAIVNQTERPQDAVQLQSQYAVESVRGARRVTVIHTGNAV